MKNIFKNIKIRFYKEAFIAAFLALGITYIIADAFNLAFYIKYPLMIIICLISSYIVIRGPKLILYIVCFSLFAMGIFMVFLAYQEELIKQINWDPNLLSAGASILGISIAFYALIDSEEKNLTTLQNEFTKEKNKDNPIKSYIWLEKEERFCCNYCLNNGKYKYYKTINGVQAHILSIHKQ